MENRSGKNKDGRLGTKQFSTFFLGESLYGIDVMQVQEVTKPMSITSIPLAPNYVKGLINLRGQIATAIGLRELFSMDEAPGEKMNVVCRVDGMLLSLWVDRIGDVVEVAEDKFELAPDTIEDKVRRFMYGVYKTDGLLLSAIDIELITAVLNR